jgi:hypothetical protein
LDDPSVDRTDAASSAGLSTASERIGSAKANGTGGIEAESKYLDIIAS